MLATESLPPLPQVRTKLHDPWQPLADPRVMAGVVRWYARGYLQTQIARALRVSPSGVCAALAKYVAEWMPEHVEDWNGGYPKVGIRSWEERRRILEATGEQTERRWLVREAFVRELDARITEIEKAGKPLGDEAGMK